MSSGPRSQARFRGIDALADRSQRQTLERAPAVPAPCFYEEAEARISAPATPAPCFYEEIETRVALPAAPAPCFYGEARARVALAPAPAPCFYGEVGARVAPPPTTSRVEATATQTASECNSRLVMQPACRAYLGEVPSSGGFSASLVRLELEDFKIFDRFEASFVDRQAVCVVGPNASGKSSLVDAVLFVLLRKEFANLHHLIRRVEPPRPSRPKASVTAHFQAECLGHVALRREVLGKSCSTIFWVARGDEPFRSVAEAEYRWWLMRALRWGESDLLLPQFSLIDGRSLSNLLKSLAAAVDTAPPAGQASAPVPLLKRRRQASSAESEQAPFAQPTSAASVGGLRGNAVKEATLARRLDEVYRELSREPLDKEMHTWGDGGQAILRRGADGGFTISVSRQRGAAAAGFGVQLSELSEGDQDVLALSLLLVMPRICRGAVAREEPPTFVLLDEPDARLDQRHARALWRFLSGPLGPKQSVILSLNNHRAFRPEDEDSLIRLE